MRTCATVSSHVSFACAFGLNETIYLLNGLEAVLFLDILDAVKIGKCAKMLQVEKCILCQQIELFHRHQPARCLFLALDLEQRLQIHLDHDLCKRICTDI